MGVPWLNPPETKFDVPVALVRRSRIGGPGSRRYDSIHLHAEAIKRAGPTDPAKIREALLKSDYVSVAGSPIRFDERQQAVPEAVGAVFDPLHTGGDMPRLVIGLAEYLVGLIALFGKRTSTTRGSSSSCTDNQRTAPGSSPENIGS